MMNQQPDKFFREKLEAFHKPAPTTAWEKIEAGLQKKNNKAIWLRVAAAVLLVAVAAFTLWTTRSTPTQQIATQTKSHDEVKRAVQERLPEVATPQPEKEQAPAKNTVTKKRAPAKTTQPSRITPATQDAMVFEETTTTELALHTADSFNAVDSSWSEPGVVAEETQVVATPIEEEKEESRVLVFSVEEVDAKYLDKEALAKATSAQKKSSTFRKLLNKAYDLKNNQDPIGDLRQKKNEILALNFKSEKRSQNK